RQVCAICLTDSQHHQGPIHRCNAELLWSGGKARCYRNEKNRIAAPGGREICLDWQRTRGCSSQSGRHLHECSGCASPNHGAHSCPLAQTD
ncbi:hypothetical protein K474DRAFT_1558384, partial [Panus rudis PR-1116 ss-1]